MALARNGNEGNHGTGDIGGDFGTTAAEYVVITGPRDNSDRTRGRAPRSRRHDGNYYHDNYTFILVK